MRATVVLLLLAVVAPMALGGDEKVENEKKKFVGNWTLASGQVDGKPVADEDVKRSKMTSEAEKRTLTVPHLAKDTLTSKLKRLDPSKKPAELEWVRDNGRGTDTTMLAIYEWVDEDTYRVCYDPSGKARPKEFKAAAGSGFVLHVWKRSK